MKNVSVVFVAIAILVISFLINTGLVWVACWGFGWTFTWKLAIGAYVVEMILKNIFNKVSKKC